MKVNDTVVVRVGNRLGHTAKVIDIRRCIWVKFRDGEVGHYKYQQLLNVSK